jgi:hypothetical protein
MYNIFNNKNNLIIYGVFNPRKLFNYSKNTYGIDLLSGWDFEDTTWINGIAANIIDNNSFYSTINGYGIIKNSVFTIGKSYSVTIKAGTNCNAIAGNGNITDVELGADGTYLTGIITSDITSLYLKNIIAGTTNVTTLIVKEKI